MKSDYNFRVHHKLVLPQPNSSCKIHSFSLGSKAVDNLPDKLTTTESLSLFTKNLKRMTLSSYNCNCISCK